MNVGNITWIPHCVTHMSNWKSVQNMWGHYPPFEASLNTSATSSGKNVNGLWLECVSINNKKQETCRLGQSQGLLPEEASGKRKGQNQSVSTLRPRKTNQTGHFIQRGRHVAVYIRATHGVNLDTSPLLQSAAAHMHSSPPNKVYRTTRRHIPTVDTSGLGARASKPRHLCHSHLHAVTTHRGQVIKTVL